MFIATNSLNLLCSEESILLISQPHRGCASRRNLFRVEIRTPDRPRVEATLGTATKPLRGTDPANYVLTVDLDLSAIPNSDLTSTGRNKNSSDSERFVSIRKYPIIKNEIKL